MEPAQLNQGLEPPPERPAEILGELPADVASADQRAAPRFTLLIRAAKLVSAQGEFVCVIRDVSETGVSVRLFHALPTCTDYALHMPAGAIYEISRVWQRDNEAGFSFDGSVDVAKLVNESSEYPKRGLRLGLCFPVMVHGLTGSFEAVVENLSQQGARITCDALLSIDQNVRIVVPSLMGKPRDVRAKVRWRRDRHYGVVFDDTFTLGEFARLAALLQAPALLEG
ncbi:PilZ domain-containing protein [Porphyrobacter sp. YT40]|uniref:PilZ domain-containing protein n=1 Tax=Porphyrobacter sp. YT40 TaxID=2547601 RepID=UPI001144D4AA|nr:PilZ domain-containing protein [Porphyrobacter sp. YT40]QDH33367.1 PilZ domain-containing protein [Porphyrobacter sp. YT40]